MMKAMSTTVLGLKISRFCMSPSLKYNVFVVFVCVVIVVVLAVVVVFGGVGEF